MQGVPWCCVCLPCSCIVGACAWAAAYPGALALRIWLVFLNLLQFFLCEMVIFFFNFFFFHLCCLLVCQGVQGALHSCFALGVCRGLEVGTLNRTVGSLANAKCFPGIFHDFSCSLHGLALPLAGSSPWQLTDLGESVVKMLLVVCISLMMVLYEGFH